MKRLILFLLLAGSAFAAPNYRDYLVKFEGRSTYPYQTTADKGTNRWHVGIGHVLPGKPAPRYSTSELDAFFRADLAAALSACRTWVPSFDSQPDNVKLVIVSLAFTVGRTGLAKFVGFRAAIAAKDYRKAAEELRRSKWAGQVGKTRLEDHVQKLINTP